MTGKAPEKPAAGFRWQVYMILCSDGSLYTGITTRIERRFAEHGAGRGARFFRGRRPQRVVYLETGHSRSSAARREHAIKRMNRAAKQALVDAGQVRGRSAAQVPAWNGSAKSREPQRP